jgi:hypothetical protein
MFRIAFVLALAAAAAGPALAETKKAAPAERPDDIVCTYEQSTGSHIKKRTCMTRGQRAERAQRDREMLDRVQDRNMRGAGPSTN